MLLGSARVSKGEEQDSRMQETALRAAGVERLFTSAPRAAAGIAPSSTGCSSSCAPRMWSSFGNWTGCPARSKISST